MMLEMCRRGVLEKDKERAKKQREKTSCLLASHSFTCVNSKDVIKNSFKRSKNSFFSALKAETLLRKEKKVTQNPPFNLARRWVVQVRMKNGSWAGEKGEKSRKRSKVEPFSPDILRCRE